MSNDKPTAFEIKPDTYKAEPVDPSDANPAVISAGGVVSFSDDRNTVHYPVAAIPALIDALKQLGGAPNE